ncbi:MAG TPA: aspartyl protease family protein [Candidatus Tectomicrobia bacterium]|nr:aspartyl protease family protein [Candidatus Tectomicrobia bacterium]
MRGTLVFVAGIVVGQWLAFGGAPSPAPVHRQAREAWERRDYVGAMHLWSRAIALAPDNPDFHYWRGTALARLGLRLSAADAYQVALLLGLPPEMSRRALEELRRLDHPVAPGPETLVPLEDGRGVWVARVVLNGRHDARFLVDTGSSVTVLAPALAEALGVAGPAGSPPIELHTLGGRTEGRLGRLASLRVGTVEVRDATVVLHEPGPGLDGILGNDVLARYLLTLDADARLLRLRPPAD